MRIQLGWILSWQAMYKYFFLYSTVLFGGIVILLCVTTFSCFAAGSDSSDGNTSSSKRLKTNSISKLRNKINVLEKKLSDVYKRKDYERKALRKVDQIIATIDNRLREKKLLLGKLGNRLTELQTRKQALTNMINRNKLAVISQIRQDFAQLRQNRLRLVLGVSELPKLKRGLIYQEYVNLVRREKLKQIRARLREIQQINHEISKKKIGVNKTKQQQARIRNKFQQESQRRSVILAALSKSEKKYIRKVSRLKKDSGDLRNVYTYINTAVQSVPVDESLARRHFSQLKGKLLWPTKGLIVSKFGKSSKLGLIHKQGVLISAADGQEVKTIANGRVVFANWLGSFGMIIIVDHGNNYLSLYGHNRSLHKKVGDQVQIGEVIASAGSSGGVKRSALYFEIRKQGVPQNPARWCKFWPQLN